MAVLERLELSMLLELCMLEQQHVTLLTLCSRVVVSHYRQVTAAIRCFLIDAVITSLSSVLTRQTTATLSFHISHFGNMSTGGLSHPSVLPFSLVSYDGSKPEDEDDDPIENVLLADPELVHCSRDGRNFNLLLQYTPSIASPAASCTLTHVVIHGPTHYTAPVDTGIVFASLDLPDIAAYTRRYDDITRQQYEQLPLSTLQTDGAVAFFTLTDLDRLQIAVTLPSWAECRYLHIKLLSARSEVDDNIDVARVAAVGFDTAQRPAEEVTLPATVVQQLGLTKEELGRWNRLSADHMRTLRQEPACILFGSDPMKAETTAARTLLHAIAMSGAYDGSLTFYHYDDSSSEKAFASAIADMAGLGPLDEPREQQLQGEEGAARPSSLSSDDGAAQSKRPLTAIVIGELDSNRRHHYSGQLDDASLRAWLDAYAAGTLTPFVKSQPRPVGDLDVSNANVTVVTAATFDELVVGSDVSVLLFVVSDDENALVSAVVRSWLYACADVVTLPQLRVASFDAESNDVPAAIPTSAVPGILLFPSHDKQAVARLSELPVPRSLVRFLQKQLPSLELDTEALLISPRLESAFAYTCLLLDCQQALRNHAGPAEALQWALTAEEKDRLEEVNDTVGRALQALIQRGEGDVELQTGVRAALQRMEDEYATHQPLVDELEAAQQLMNDVSGQMRNAMDTLSEEEFNKVSGSIAYVSFALPREKKERSSGAVSDDSSDIKQASETEPNAGDDESSDRADKEWEQAKAAPFSRDRLHSTVDKLRQVHTTAHSSQQGTPDTRIEGQAAHCHRLMCITGRVACVGVRWCEGQAGGSTSGAGCTRRRSSGEVPLGAGAVRCSHRRRSRPAADCHRLHGRVVRSVQAGGAHLRPAECAESECAVRQSRRGRVWRRQRRVRRGGDAHIRVCARWQGAEAVSHTGSQCEGTHS